jgi:antitoxin VapB
MKTLISQYQVRLFHNGRNQTLNIPHAFEMPSNDVVIRKEGERLIIEPFKKRYLLELLAILPDIDEDFPNVDEELLPLDDIQF